MAKLDLLGYEQIFNQQLELIESQLSLLAKSLAVESASLPNDIPNEVPSPTKQGKQTPESHSVTTKQAKYVEEFSESYNLVHQKSRAYAEQHRAYLADSRRAAGFRAATRSLLYPIVGASAHGAHMQDVDGNEYIDLTMGFGVLLAGHSPSFLNESYAAHRATGLDLGPQSALAGEVARLIVELTGMPRVTFCNSGTEAVMTALRLARSTTGRSKVVMFSGSYHGHFDGVLALNGVSESLPASRGTPGGFIQDLVVLEYGSDDALAAIQADCDQLAAVLVEPVQSRTPEKQPLNFLRALRKICDASGTALIFDELLTGFRIAQGGAQAWFNIQADLVTYGKIVGGGTPIGVIAGRGKFLDGIDGGNWGTDSLLLPEADRIFFAGTFNKNGATMSAAHAMLSYLQETGPQLQQHLNAMTDGLANRLNELFRRRRLSMRVTWFGSMFRFVILKDADLFFYHLIQNGIYVWEGRTCFLSSAHAIRETAIVLDAVERSLDDLQSGGFCLPSSS